MLRAWNLGRPYRPLQGLDQHLRSRPGFLENPSRLERARSEPAELPQFDEDLLMSSPQICCLDNHDKVPSWWHEGGCVVYHSRCNTIGPAGRRHRRPIHHLADFRAF